MTASRQLTFGKAASRPVIPTAPVSTTILTPSAVPQRSGVHSGRERNLVRIWSQTVTIHAYIHSSHCEACYGLRPGLSDFGDCHIWAFSPMIFCFVFVAFIWVKFTLPR